MHRSEPTSTLVRSDSRERTHNHRPQTRVCRECGAGARGTREPSPGRPPRREGAPARRRGPAVQWLRFRSPATARRSSPVVPRREHGSVQVVVLEEGLGHVGRLLLVDDVGLVHGGHVLGGERSRDLVDEVDEVLAVGVDERPGTSPGRCCRRRHRLVVLQHDEAVIGDLRDRSRRGRHVELVRLRAHRPDRCRGPRSSARDRRRRPASDRGCRRRWSRSPTVHPA